MKTSTKAMLASAFIFPGLGQLILKRYISGVGLISVASIATLVLLAHIVMIAKQVVDQILGSNIQTDVLTLREMVKTQIANSNAQALNISIGVLLLVWIVSVLDVYRLRKS